MTDEYEKSGKAELPPKSGPVAFVIGGDPEKKIVIFQFGHAISRLEFSPEEALEIASNIMSRAAIASGKSLEQLAAERQRLVDDSRKAPRVAAIGADDVEDLNKV